MNMKLRHWLISGLLFLLGVNAWAAETELVDTGKVNAQLVTTHDSVAPGDSIHIALRTVLDLDWHTYWRNPGDSGEPVQITWDVPEGVTYGDIIWPLPKPIATGPIINYGFEDVPFFPVPFTIPETAQPGELIEINADIYYLVCKDVCIPESTQQTLILPVGESVLDARWDPVIRGAIDDAPVAESATAGIAKSGDKVLINVQGLNADDVSKAYYFPFEQGVIDHSALQTVRVGSNGFQIETTPGFDWENGRPGSADGLISFIRGGKDQGANIVVTVGAVPDVGVAAPVTPTSQAASYGLISAIIGAFIGGLILNLMPCVFPVISIKALNIAKKAHGDRAAVRRQAWLYTAGVVATFLLLTGLLLALKAGGAELGWGFQLQSPVLVAFLAILLFLIGLNLLGMFEIGQGLQNTGQTLTMGDGWSGSFFTGVLAVIVATPCTAPFMAGAIGYALTAPAVTTFLVFMALALGFALPFLLIAYVPGLISRLPKPGPWMVRFKEFLAFPMFGAAIWLVWVLTMQAGGQGLLMALSAMLAAAFAIWMFKRPAKIAKVLAAIAVLGVFAAPISLRTANAEVDVHGEAWSTERVAELRADGRAVFVDFTAAWCVTCKVNERLVLNTEEVKQAFIDTNTAFLVADWTNQDDRIAQELAKYGRSGVPLYLLFPPGHNDVSAEILPQILTKDMLIERLQGVNASLPDS